MLQSACPFINMRRLSMQKLGTATSSVSYHCCIVINSPWFENSGLRLVIFTRSINHFVFLSFSLPSELFFLAILRTCFVERFRIAICKARSDNLMKWSGYPLITQSSSSITRAPWINIRRALQCSSLSGVWSLGL